VGEFAGREEVDVLALGDGEPDDGVSQDEVDEVEDEQPVARPLVA
jgi:hypothetical protein